MLIADLKSQELNLACRKNLDKKIESIEESLRRGLVSITRKPSQDYKTVIYEIIWLIKKQSPLLLLLILLPFFIYLLVLRTFISI